jgi:hypothetical protein
MRKAIFLILVLAAIFVSLIPISAQVSINTTLSTGTMTGSVANAYRTAYLHFQLVNCGDNTPVIPGQPTAIAQDSFDLRPITPGSAIIGSILGNDQITCGNVISTYYVLTVMKDASHPLRDGVPFVICSASAAIHTCGNQASLGAFNLVTADPMTQPPPQPGFSLVYENPTNSQSITQPPGTQMNLYGMFNFVNGVFVGSTTFANLGNVYPFANEIYVSDAVAGSSPCAGGGGGSWAFYQAGAWTCGLGGGGGGGGSGSAVAPATISFSSVTSVTLPTTFISVPIVSDCWDLSGHAIPLLNGTPQISSTTPYSLTFNFQSLLPQSGHCDAFGVGPNGPPPPPPGGQVSLTPATFNFGLISLGATSAPQTFTLNNATSGTLSGIAAPTITGPQAADFSIVAGSNNCGSSLAASANCTFQAQCRPSLTTQETATITVTEASPSGSQTVSLTCQGYNGTPGVISLAPALLSFPNTNINQSSAPLFSTVAWLSGNNVTFSNVALTLGTEFSLTPSPNCGVIGPTNPTCTVYVTFTPTSGGTFNDTVTLYDNASTPTQQIAVTGTGVSPGAFSLTSVTIAPTNPNVPVGATLPFSCVDNYSDGSTRPCANIIPYSGPVATGTGWFSATPADLTIDSSGLGTGVAGGSSLVTTNSARVNVVSNQNQIVSAQAGSSGGGGGTPTLVQVPSTSHGNSGGALTVALGSNATAGNSLWVGCFSKYSGGGGFATSFVVADTLGNTWNSAAAIANGSQIFYAKNITGGADSVTCTPSGTGTSQHTDLVGPMEIAGASTTGPLDAIGSQNTGTGTAITSTVTTSNTNDMLWTWSYGQDGSVSKYNYLWHNFQTGINYNANFLGDYSGSITPAGAQTCNATQASSAAWWSWCFAITGGSGSSSSTLTLTTPPFGNPNGMGNDIVVPISWQDATATIPSVTDVAGNTYAQNTGCLIQAGGMSSTIYHASGIPAVANNKITVTWSGTGAQGVVNIAALEYQGLTGVADGNCVTGSGTGTSPSISVTPGQAAEVIPAIVAATTPVNAITGSGVNSRSAYVNSVTFDEDVYSTSAVTFAGTLLSSGNWVMSALRLKSFNASTTATISGSGAPYTIDNPPQVGWYPGGPGSLFNVPMPTPSGTGAANGANVRCAGASSDGITAANCATSDAVVLANMAAYNGTSYDCGDNGVTQGQNCGFFDSGNVGNSADQTIPIYYGYATDPNSRWFKTGNACDLDTPGERFSFVAPQNLQFSGSTGDQQASVYDEVQGLWVSMYAANKGSNFSLGPSNCPGNGPASCAQQIPGISACTAQRIGIDPDYGNGLQTVTITSSGGTNTYTIGGLSSAFAAVTQPVIRWNEFAAGIIPHATQATVPCVDNSSFPFPNIGRNTLAGCNPSVAYAFHPGAAVFCDYTAPQIQSMHISQWAKGILTSNCTYGMYVGATTNTVFPGNAVNGLSPGGTASVEGPQASSFYGSNWYLNQLNLVVAQGGWGGGACGTSGYAFGCVYNNSNGNPPPWRFEALVYEGIDLLQGPAGSGSIDVQGRNCGTTPCDFTGHFHEMDQCKIKTMAGLSAAQGGC